MMPPWGTWMTGTGECRPGRVVAGRVRRTQPAYVQRRLALAALTGDQPVGLVWLRVIVATISVEPRVRWNTRWTVHAGDSCTPALPPWPLWELVADDAIVVTFAPFRPGRPASVRVTRVPRSRPMPHDDFSAAVQAALDGEYL